MIGNRRGPDGGFATPCPTRASGDATRHGLCSMRRGSQAVADTPRTGEVDQMEFRRCTHCQSEIELPAESRVCPVCGLDPDLPAIDFDDAPAFFLSGEPALAPIPIVPGAPARVIKTR